ncbi:MAG: AsnC family transcriptional regulator [Rhodospirillales bacterium]
MGIQKTKRASADTPAGDSAATAAVGDGVFQAGMPKSRTLASPQDDLNRAIVETLKEDGRRPFKDIAEELRISEGTVRNRVSWMKKSGMLRIVAVADPASFQYRADAMLGIKVAPGNTPEEVASRLSPFSEVVYILWVTGRFDLLVEVVFEDDADFQAFLQKNVFGHTDVAHVEVMSGIQMFKNQFLLKRDLP